MVKLFCLGSPRIERLADASPIHLTPKATALLIYLATMPYPHDRDVLADLLWYDMDNQQARTNLRYLLPELRRQVADALIITTKSISFNRQVAYWLDVDELRTTLALPLESLSNQSLQSALDLYHGEFLAGFTVRNAPVFDTWLVRQRERLHALVLQSYYTLAERYWRQQEYRNALDTTRRLLSWEPWHEAGHRLQMQLLAATGQRGAALAQYALCQQILADELAVTPEAATTALYEQIRHSTYAQGTPDLAPPLSLHPVALSPAESSSGARSQPIPHNLPAIASSFLGREQELIEIGTQLQQPHPRLISLVGEGGVGKTRLALATAQKLLYSATESNEKPKAESQKPKFKDGIWFISLNGIVATDKLADQLAIAVGKAIGLPFSGQRPLLTQLLAYLHEKALLLLFDNAEHLLPDLVDFLLALLESCPQLTLLVTSRHRIMLQAEFVHTVIGLPVPPTADQLPAVTTDLTAYSSVALFVERAQSSNLRFHLTTANFASLVAICRLAEGLPLAIELAAALTRYYTCAEIYAALHHDYTILATASADLPSRQRSIQATLDYSWRFLTPAQAQILAACTVFAGDFTRQAAAAVVGADTTLLNTLVDQSLLQLHNGRFAMHALVRQHAAARLAQLPAVHTQIVAAHAAYYIDLLHQQEGALVITFTAQQILENEIENIRAAWYSCVKQHDLPLLAKGLESLHYFYRLTGLYREAIQCLEAALDAVSTVISAASTVPPPLTLLARLLCHTAEFYRRIGGGETGERLAQEALALGQRQTDSALQGLAYHTLARLAYTHNHYQRQRHLAEEGYRQAYQAGDPLLMAECLNDLGLALGASTGPLAALPYFQQALTILQGATNRILEAYILVNLGYFSLASCQYQAAYTYLQQGLTLQRQLQDRGGRLPTLVHLVHLWLALGAYDAVFPIYTEALALAQTTGNPYWESRLRTTYGRWQQLCGDPIAARISCVYARELAQRSDAQLEEQWALLCLGHTLTALGETAAAYQIYQQAIGLHSAGGWLQCTADAYAGLAALLLSQNQVTDAVTHVEVALAILTQHGLAAAAEPFTVYWTAVRVFTAAADTRASIILRTAYQALQDAASQLQDEALRRSFCQMVTVNRQLLMAAESAGIGCSPC